MPFKTLLRIRLGLFTQNAAAGPYHNPHVDFYLPHQNALYYVNDSDGDTFIFNETYDDVSLERLVDFTRDGKFTTGATGRPQEGTDGRLRRQALPREHAPGAELAPGRDRVQLRLTPARAPLLRHPRRDPGRDDVLLGERDVCRAAGAC